MLAETGVRRGAECKESKSEAEEPGMGVAGGEGL